jgi:hypothetical protein
MWLTAEAGRRQALCVGSDVARRYFVDQRNYAPG